MLYPLSLNKADCISPEAVEQEFFSYSPTSGATVFDYDTGKIDDRLIFGNHSREVDFTIIVTNWRIVFKLSSRECAFVQYVDMSYHDLTQVSVNSDDYLSIYGDHRSSSMFAGGTVFISNGVLCFGFQPARPHYVAGQIAINIAASLVIGSQLTLLDRIDFTSLRLPGDFIETNIELVSALREKGFEIIDDQPLTFPQPERNALENKNLLTRKHADGADHGSKDHEALIDFIRMPRLRSGMHSGLLIGWLKVDGDIFEKGDHLFSVGYSGELIKVFADKKGTIIEIFHESDTQSAVGEILASVEYANSTSSSPKESSSSPSSIVTEEFHAVTHSRVTTSEAMQSRASVAEAGQLPSFFASPAVVPEGFVSTGSDESDLNFAISNPRIGFQSFFNDLDIVVDSGLNDDVINLPCFDEDLYSRLTREMHRYTLAEVGDQKDTLAKQNARLGTFVGALFGVLTSNPFAPFWGRNLGRSETDRGKRISEFLPDPHLLFYQDENSFLSWSRAQVLAPRIRRVIFSKMQKEDGKIYFRLLPSLVTADSVLPIQVFKLDKSSYFYRPFAAGIDRQQQHYDAVKIQRRYMHVHAQGVVSKSELSMTVSGSDIEDCQTSLYRFSGQSLEYFYADFKILPGYVF